MPVMSLSISIVDGRIEQFTLLPGIVKDSS